MKRKYRFSLLALLFFICWSLWATFTTLLRTEYFLPKHFSSGSVMISGTNNSTKTSPELHVPKESRPIPNFRGGGVILYMHMAKAGGTTIREFFLSSPNVIVAPRVKFSDILPKIKLWVTGDFQKNQTLMVEIHDGLNPSYVDIASIIDRLRSQAHANKVPFFVFTTVREPLSHAISFYNFEHLDGGRGGRYVTGKPTEEDLIKILIPNMQCLFVARGDIAMWKDWATLKFGLTDEECEEAYNVIVKTMDWVGTTERMSNETLPLLASILTGDPSKGIEMKPKNVQNKKKKDTIIKENLSSHAIDHIWNITRVDSEWYQKIQRDYVMSMWNLTNI